MIAASGLMMRGSANIEMPNLDPMAAEAGAAATLCKPFKPAELLAAIRKVLAVAV